MAITNINMRTQIKGTKQNAEIEIVHHIMAMETILVRFVMARCSRKLRIYGPNLGCRINHRYKRTELLKYNAAVNSKKGVVGNTGKKIPNTPNARLMLPRKI